MQFKVKQMILEHFKGVENKVYNFGKRTFIKAKNGLGKTTIVDAHDWLWFGKDSTLASNPEIVTMRDGEKYYDNPVKVTEVIEIDGREATVTKIQKNKFQRTGAGGIHKLITSNSYEINCVPKTEKEFKGYFEELGINFDELLACSHIDVFLNQKQADMRKVLFSMASGKSDLEICQGKKNLAQLHGLLEKGYKTDEVQAMYDRKVKDADKELNGIDPKISENQRQIVDIDVQGLTASKEGILKVITDCENQLNDVDAQASIINDLKAEIMKVQLDIGDCERKANQSLVDQKRAIQNKIDSIATEIYKKECNIESKKRERSSTVSSMNEDALAYKDALTHYNEWKAQTFDESKLICPTCKQNLPQEKADELKENFESQKRSNMEGYKSKGKAKSESYNKRKAEIEEIDKLIATFESEKETLEQQNHKLESELSAFPQSVDMSKNEEYIFLQSELRKMQQRVSEMPNQDELKTTVRNEIQKNRETLAAIERELSKVNSNMKIQERISELESERVKLSQQKSDAEMILDQLKQLSREKNSLLAEEINSKFGNVSWKLFDYQKDGSYKEVCIPLLEGFTYDKMNGARRVTAKIDIIAGLQNFYGISVPLFVDEMESVNDENVPVTEFQMVMMKVTEDSELKVEVQ